VLGVAEEMLAELGYQPVGYHSPERALEAFEADPARFDVVMLDERMPGMTGSELAGAAAQSAGRSASAHRHRLRRRGVRSARNKLA
jgi:CheY-like chemotaxis protein